MASLGERLQKRPAAYLATFVLLYLAVTLVVARRPLWYDELVTYHVSQIPGSQLWDALREGIDLNPPLIYWVTAAFHKLFGVGSVTTRMPAIFGFLVMLLAIYSFAARRLARPYAFAALLLPVLTSGYYYASEARSYGLELGFLGLGLVGWQRANELSRPWWPIPLLYLGLLGALLSHSYALAAMPAFGLAQLALDYERKRPDWKIWMAFVALTPVLALYAASMATVKAAVLGDKVYTPTLLSVPSFYGTLLKNAIWPLLAGVLYVNRWSSTPEPTRPTHGLPKHESICAALLLLTPVFVYAMAVGVTGVYFDRYAMAAMMGLSLLVAHYAQVRAAGNLQAGAGLAAIFAVGIVCFSIGAVLSYLKTSGGALRVDLATASPNLPIVVSNGLMFLELDHRETPEVAKRLHYLTDSASSLKYVGANPFDMNYPIARKWFRLRGSIADHREFLSRHSEFLVFGTYSYPMDWIIRSLLDEGARIQFLGGTASPYGEALLMRVTTTGKPTEQPPPSPPMTSSDDARLHAQ